LRAGIVKDLGELKKYRWCGHRALLGNAKYKWQKIEKIMQYFGEGKSKAIREYLEFVASAQTEGKRDDLEGGGLIRSQKGWEVRSGGNSEYWCSDERVLGESDFVEQIIISAEKEGCEKDKIKKQEWPWNRLAKEVCVLYNVNPGDLSKKWRVQKARVAKAIAAYLGKKYLGYTCVEMAKHLEMKKSAVSKLVQKGEKLVKEEDVKRLFGLRPA
jgi:putative transposase